MPHRRLNMRVHIRRPHRATARLGDLPMDRQDRPMARRMEDQATARHREHTINRARRWHIRRLEDMDLGIDSRGVMWMIGEERDLWRPCWRV
jgi:hypothetical protein